MRILVLVVLTLAASGCVSMMQNFSPLQRAAYDGDFDRANALMAQGADPGQIEANGSDAISAAAQRHPDLARRLLAHCVENFAPGLCPRALEDAALIGDENAARKLLMKGADPDAAIADIQQQNAQMQQVMGQMSGMLIGGLANSPELQRASAQRFQAIALLRRLRAEQAQAAADAKANPVSNAQPASTPPAKPWWE